MLNLKPTDSVLDLGCGEGFLINKFKSYCTKITGVDISDKALKTASKINPNCEFFKEDIIELDLPKKPFDVVYCFEVLQYIQQKQLVFNKMFQLARRSVVFSVPNYDSFWAYITKARQALFGVQDYPDSTTKQWFKKSQLFVFPNYICEFHSFASRSQKGIRGSLKYFLKRLLKYNLFIVVRIDICNE